METILKRKEEGGGRQGRKDGWKKGRKELINCRAGRQANRPYACILMQAKHLWMKCYNVCNATQNNSVS